MKSKTRIPILVIAADVFFIATQTGRDPVDDPTRVATTIDVAATALEAILPSPGLRPPKSGLD